MGPVSVVTASAMSCVLAVQSPQQRATIYHDLVRSCAFEATVPDFMRAGHPPGGCDVTLSYDKDGNIHAAAFTVWNGLFNKVGETATLNMCKTQ